MSDLRDKAVEAAAVAYHIAERGNPDMAGTPARVKRNMEKALAAAEPFIREDERRRIREWHESLGYECVAASEGQLCCVERMGES